MGNAPTKENTTDLTETNYYETLSSESFTVIRSARGEDPVYEEEGWTIKSSGHGCLCSTWAGHVSNKFPSREGWVFMMNSGKTHEQHVCGWRSLRSFWPTRLTGEAREDWFRWLEANLDVKPMATYDNNGS
jgi:hypothetical protein